MSADMQLRQLAKQAGDHLLAQGKRLVTAESCTGGWLAKTLTDVPGSSQWFERGYVTYSNAAKEHDLGVSAGTLAEHGAVSEAAAREMAVGALRMSGADAAIAITGIAGPDGGSAGKPVGTVWFGIAVRRGSLPLDVDARLRHFSGDRESIRRDSVKHALELLLSIQPLAPPPTV